MDVFKSFATALVGVAMFDWLAVTGSAARCTIFDYRYFPLSKSRIASFLLLYGTVFWLCLMVDLDNPPITPP